MLFGLTCNMDSLLMIGLGEIEAHCQTIALSGLNFILKILSCVFIQFSVFNI